MLTYKIKYHNQIFNCKVNEKLIDAFIRHGIEVNFSCKKGICHACMMLCNTGTIPKSSQYKLKIDYITKHYFLPCSCIPVSDMTISDIPSTNTYKNSNQASTKNYVSKRINTPSPLTQLPLRDEEMWDALDSGKKLKRVLDNFYSLVYQDDKLSGFFRNSSQQRSSEKQYLFMRQLFTGEKVYFGDRPKNAHHWMVIDDELFNYRESILIDCLRKHGLAENLIQRWIAYDEYFRKDIVKKSAFPKIINGVEQPLNGYDTLIIDEGTLCDGCHKAINKGETVRYHLRLGSTYCHNCMELTHTEEAL